MTHKISNVCTLYRVFLDSLVFLCFSLYIDIFWSKIDDEKHSRFDNNNFELLDLNTANSSNRLRKKKNKPYPLQCGVYRFAFFIVKKETQRFFFYPFQTFIFFTR